MPPVVEGAAVDLGVIAGIVVSLGILARSRPGKAVLGLGRRTWRRAFGQPFTTWATNLVSGAVRPEIQALSARNDDQHAANLERLEAIESRVAVVEANTTIHADRLDRGGERMDEIVGSLKQLQTDVAALHTPTVPLPTLPPTTSEERAS